MIVSSCAVRRACVAFALVSSTRVLGAQDAKVVADAGHTYLSPGLRGFEARRQAGFGHFITDSVLRAASGSRLSLLITRHVPSLTLGTGPVGGEFPISSRVCGDAINCSSPRCYARVFVDGSLVFDGTTRLRDVEGVDFSHLRPEDFSGIEFYSSAAGLPSQYAGRNTDCGTFLFWSRET